MTCNTYTIKFTLLIYTVFLFVLFLLYFQGCSVITSICIQKMFISLIRKKVLISTCSLSETSPTPETFNLRSESMWFPILGFEYKQKHTMKKNFFFLSGFFSLVKYYTIFASWKGKRQPTPAFLLGESCGWRSLMGCRLWGHTESDMTEVT